MATRMMTGVASGYAERAIASGKGAMGTSNNEINWTDFNFPFRCEPLNLVHFDLQEIKQKCGMEPFNISKLLAWWFYLVVGCTFLNLIDTIIVAATVDNLSHHWKVLYSIFNMIIGFTFGLYVMYNGYKGVAEPSPTARQKAKLGMCIALVLILTQILLGTGNVNGLGNFSSDRYDAAGSKGFWDLAIIVESIAWTVTLVLGILSLLKLHNFSGLRSQW
eukprot:TRINITY_DN776353_c0_g1_i1.p1 TRINITY_DN776353_c0_g1~~TRINITY_DN776353_c0_g1_i1.p1  ORF type:complete len:219 (-),score=50.81 TRINITY_DN776353_c0_g1_i1:164-820(-)